MFQQAAAGRAMLPCRLRSLQTAPGPYHHDVGRPESNAGLVDVSSVGLRPQRVPGSHFCLQLIFFRYADCSAEPTLNHDALAKLTVTIIVLVALLVWRVADQKKSIECGANCPTDLSASRKAAQ
ncbi:hypothetical protein ACVIHF_003294 [Bradyrhizobium sp. USDA 4506]